jgi:excisionase family DNA binding protein
MNYSNGEPSNIGTTANGFFENFKWLTTKEVAEYLGTTPKQIRKWAYQGKIKAYKLLGKSLRFKSTEIKLLIL